MATTLDQPALHAARTSTDPVNRLLSRAYTINWETVAYALIFIAALLTRFVNLGDRVMSHDESLHTRYSYNLYNEGSYQHTPLMHGPLLFHVTAFIYFLFGDNDFTARIYPAVLGILIVLSPYLFRRWLGRTGSLLASVMILISPLLMYYNRYIREDTPAIFFTLVMVYAVMMYLSGPDGQRRRARWLYLLTVGTIGNLMSKETAFFYIAIFGSFLTLYFIARLAQYFYHRPGRTIMNFLSVAILLGGVAALGMYCVLSIIRPDVAFGPAATPVDTAGFIGWTAVVFGTIIVSLIGAGLWAFRGSIARLQLHDIAIILLVAVVALGGLLYIEEKSFTKERSDETAALSEPGTEGGVVQSVISNLPIYAVWVVAAIVIAAVLVSWRRGWWRKLHRFPELDVMIILGTLILPWSAALFVYMTHASPTDYSSDGIARSLMALIPLAAISIVVGLVWNWKRWLICAVIFHLIFAFFYTTMFTNVQGLASGMVGSLGYWLEQQGVRRGNQPQYYFELIILPFYEFLPIIGSFLAMLAGLTWFWKYRRERLEETVAPALLYAPAGDAALLTDDQTDEYSDRSDGELPTLAALTGDNQDTLVEQRISAARHPSDSGLLTQVSFVLFVAWWAVLNLIAYTLAGEKMPWLGTHLTVPMILLTAWYFGRVFDHVDWSVFFKRGWLLLLLFPLLFIMLFTVAEPFLVGQAPFAGLEIRQLADLYAWIGRLAVALLTLYLIYRVSRSTGWKHLRSMVGVAAFLFLALLTFRSAFLFSFINYNDATEFGVYAHSAPAVKWVLNELTELSERTTGGMDLKFVYDNETSWPNSWYFRHFPNGVFVGSNPTPQNLKDAVAVVVGEANRSKVEPILADQYYDFDYIRMWWPMQDYFNLTAARLANTFDFSSPTSGKIREGLFDIWWSRNYKTYSDAVGAGDNWTLTKWSISDRMHLYVRKDVAAKIWNLGTGQGTAVNPASQVQVNQCTANWQPLASNVIFNQDGSAALNHPLGLSAGADGRVYVADEFNNRINIYDGLGNYVGSVGGANTTAGLNRPNGVAFGPDGNLYIADTWNYRVVVMSTSGEVLRVWGQPGQFGADAPQSPEDAFWAPRDIAVDQAGNVYVSDTGNKRIRVYSSTGTFIRDIGSGGSEIGQLDEPSGVAVSPDGRLFVADTWNHRISVFRTDGTPVTTFPVKAWLDDLGNRPYLAIDPARNLLYVTDPDAARVLVYDMNGNCVGSFGQSGDDAPDNARIKTVGGIGVDPGGNVYISDAGSNRVMGYAPFPAPASQASNGDGASNAGGGSGQIVVTAQIGAPTEESTSEATVEAPAAATPETSVSPTEEASG